MFTVQLFTDFTNCFRPLTTDSKSSTTKLIEYLVIWLKLENATLKSLHFIVYQTVFWGLEKQTAQVRISGMLHNHSTESKFVFR